MTKAISNGIGILLRYLVKEVAKKKQKLKQEGEERQRIRKRQRGGNIGEEGQVRCGSCV